MIKHLQIVALLLTTLYSTETITHTVSLEYRLTEKFKLFALKDIISIEIGSKNIVIKPAGFGTSILEEKLEYNNQELSDNNLLYTLLIKNIIPATEDEWIDSFFLLDSLAVKARFLFSERIIPFRLPFFKNNETFSRRSDGKLSILV